MESDFSVSAAAAAAATAMLDEIRKPPSFSVQFVVDDDVVVSFYSVFSFLVYAKLMTLPLDCKTKFLCDNVSNLQLSYSVNQFTPSSNSSVSQT
jgi:hypothetical protein